MNSPQSPQPATLKVLLALAWPIIISRSSQVVVGVCDAVMVAHLGKAALAATTTGAFNTFALLIFPMGIVFIVSSYSAQLFGKGDVVGARRYGFYGLAVAALAQLLSFGGVAVAPWALAQLGYEEDVRRLMAGYFYLRMLSGGAAIGLEALANYYGGLGRTRLPMIANVAAMVLNVGLNWVLINGNLGAPAMGVSGAALASSISTGTAFAGLLAFFLYEGRAAGAVLPRLHLGEFWRMLKFGVPSGLNWFFEFFAFNFFINVVMVGLGTGALAAMMAVLQINSVSFMPAFGVSSAGAILVGQFIGAGQKERVGGIVWLTFKTNAAWQGLVGLLYLAVPALLFAPFLSKEADAHLMLEVGARMLMLSAAWQLFDAAVSTVAEALRAAGDTAYTLWARLIIAWALFVPGSYVTVRLLGGGDVVAMAWVVGYLAVLAAVLAFRFRGGAWKKLELVDPTAAPALSAGERPMAPDAAGR
jgi:multidrug resistance protein, MATE family